MAADLDRAYVINGDDLRIALAKMAVVANPRDAAAKLLRQSGYPDAGVVDATITGDAPDAELAAMAALLPALPLVSKLSHDARARVMDWARSRACDGLAPF